MIRIYRDMLMSGLMLGACALTAAAQTQVQNYWDFEGGYNDKAGIAHGTAGSEVTAAAGHDGNTAMFAPGTLSGGGGFTADGYVDLPAADVHNSGADGFSMSYWFRIADDGGTNARGIFDFSGDGGDGPQSLYIGTSNSLAFRVDGLGGGGAALYNNGGAGFEDDAWHFVAATYDPTAGIELHVDGYGIDASAGGFGTVNWDIDQYLGAFNVNGIATARGLDGALDDVAIYSGVLNEAEITGLADGTLSPLEIPEPTALALCLVGAAMLIRRR